MSIAAVLTAYYMSRLVFLTFFGEARWDDEPTRPRASITPRPAARVARAHDGAARDPRGRLDDRRHDRAAVRAASHFLEEFDEPSVRRASRCEVTLSGAAEVAAHLHRDGASRSSASSSPTRRGSSTRSRPTSSSPSAAAATPGTSTTAYAAFFGGPGRKSAPSSTREVVDHEGHRRRGRTVSAGSSRARPGSCASCRRATCAATRSASLAGAALLLAWFVDPGERLMDFPILTALVLIPAVSAVIVALLPARRPEVVRLFGLLAATLTGALSIALLVDFDRDERRLPVRLVPRVDPVVRHLVAPRRRRHLAVPRRAHRRAVPDRAVRRRREAATRRRTRRGCSCSRRAASARSSRSTCSSSSSASRSCSCRCTSSSGSGATATACTPRPSSSCSRCSARRSCSSASSRRRSSTSGARRRRSRSTSSPSPRTPASRRARRGGCSSRSRSRSR